MRCDGRTLGEWQRWFVLIVAAIAVLPSLPIAAMYFAALRVAFLFGHWPHLGNPDASAMPENLQPGSGPLGLLGPLAVYVASAALFAALVLRHSRRSWRVPLALLAGLLTWVVLLLFFPGIPPVSGNGSWIELVAGAVESEASSADSPIGRRAGARAVQYSVPLMAKGLISNGWCQSCRAVLASGHGLRRQRSEERRDPKLLRGQQLEEPPGRTRCLAAVERHRFFQAGGPAVV